MTVEVAAAALVALVAQAAALVAVPVGMYSSKFHT